MKSVTDLTCTEAVGGLPKPRGQARVGGASLLRSEVAFRDLYPARCGPNPSDKDRLEPTVGGLAEPRIAAEGSAADNTRACPLVVAMQAIRVLGRDVALVRRFSKLQVRP